jgi:hypothetical protein
VRVLIGGKVKVSVMVAVLAVKVLVGEIAEETAGGSVGTGAVHPIRTKIKIKLITNFNFFVWFSFSSLQVIHHIFNISGWI